MVRVMDGWPPNKAIVCPKCGVRGPDTDGETVTLLVEGESIYHPRCLKVEKVGE